MFKVGTVVRSIEGWQNAHCDHGTGGEFDLEPGMLAVVIALYPDEEDDRDMQLRDFDGRTHTWSAKLWSWELVDDQV